MGCSAKDLYSIPPNSHFFVQIAAISNLCYLCLVHTIQRMGYIEENENEEQIKKGRTITAIPTKKKGGKKS